MTEMLRDLQDAMLALDQRLAALESSRDGASDETRKLAQGVADMGGALSRRVRALEQGRGDPAPILARPIALAPPQAARAPRRNWVAWIVGLGFIAIVALAAVWLLRAESLDRAAITAPPKAVSAAPAAPPATDETAAPPPVEPTTSPQAAVATHRPAPSRHSSADALPGSGSTPPPGGYAHYGASPSAAPAPATNPPS
jgi:hypothetical protein